MSRCVAWLRAVNVGGRFVKMERLRALAEGAGLRGVATYIQSGNLLFDARAREIAAMEPRLERLWRAELPWEVATLVRTGPQIDALVEDGEALDPGLRGTPRHYVVFLRAEPDREARRVLEGWCDQRERLVPRGRELHFFCSLPSHEARFGNARLERLLGAPSTLRDWKTILAVRDLLGGSRR